MFYPEIKFMVPNYHGIVAHFGHHTKVHFAPVELKPRSSLEDISGI